MGYAIRRGLLIAAMLVAGCGGGSDEEPPVIGIEVTDIRYPGWEQNPQERYSTQYDWVTISVRVSELGAAISWTNSAGGSGQTTLQKTSCVDPFGLTWQCGDVEWSFDVPLALGDNRIRIVATTGNNGFGETSLTIKRTECTSWECLSYNHRCPLIFFGDWCLIGR